MERVQLPDVLEGDIRALLPELPFQKEHVNSSDVLTEETLEHLKAFLEKHPPAKPWSANPRLYALLRMSTAAGEEDLTERPYTHDDLLACGLSDYALPFSSATLPAIIREQADTAKRLLKLQSMVKSSPESMSFRDGILTHRNSKITPFNTTRTLPLIQGSFGQVESVLNTRTELVFARKTMLRSRDSRHGPMSDKGAQADRQWRLKHFKNEVEILQKLDHEHLVRFCGSYTDETVFALLVQPLAERTLHDLLVEPTPLSIEDSAMLRKSFGCLAFGLAWLHSRLIRHKDIKPANILISGERMLFCDFGSAMDAELLETTQTEGLAVMRTPRYISPETHEGKQRNEASDIWSLGCVFLEMLTVLTNSSVDELLDYIRHEVDGSGQTNDVCYWMGVSSDILQRRIVQLAEVPEVHVVADWTSKMVKEAPEKRPSAATLVKAAQSRENGLPGTGHIGSCCMASEVPLLPQPREFQPSPPVSPKQVADWYSVNSTPTTGWNGPREGTTTTNPTPVIKAPTPSTHSRTDSAWQNTGQPTGSGEPQVGELLFQAPLASESFQILEPRQASGDLFSCTRELRLYELLETDLYRTTRRLKFLPGEDANPADRLEFWLPLADTAVVRRGADVIISWSDCNQLESYATVNGSTPYSRVYRRMKPNNTLLIHFETAADARNFACQISEPRKAKASPRGWSVNLSPYATFGTWGFDNNGNAQKYNVSPEVMYTVQGFDGLAGSDGPSRGLLVKADNDLTASTSRIYWLPPAIDIKLGLEYTSDHAESKPSVSLMDLSVAGYKSNVQRVHVSNSGKPGVCQEVELSPCSVSWRFENIHDRHTFLDGISEWSLRLCTSVKCVSKMRRLPSPKKYGKADLLFWSNDKGSAVVGFRLEEMTPGNVIWITGHLTTPGASESYAGLTATIKMTSCCRGDKLNLNLMDAVPAARPEVDEDHQDTNMNKTIKIEFYHSDDMTYFQQQIGVYRRGHRGGASASARHVSSVSSDGNGVRAFGHSLSIQTTSSSSRQS